MPVPPTAASGADDGRPPSAAAWAPPDAPGGTATGLSGPTPPTAPQGETDDDRHARGQRLPAPLRPLTIGDIIDGAFQVLKRAPRTVLAVSAVFTIPVQVLAVWLQRDASGDLEVFINDASEMSGSALDGTQLGLNLVVVLLGVIGPALVGAALAPLVASWYAGRDLTTGDTFRSLVAVLPAVLGAFVVSHLLIGAGLLACFLPGLVATVFLVLVMPVVAVERVGPIVGLQRSMRLVSRRFWIVAAVVALSAIGSIVLETSLSLVPTVLALFVPEALGWLVLAVGASLAALIVTPVVAAATVLLYIDLRFRTEGLDLELRATDLLDAGAR